MCIYVEDTKTRYRVTDLSSLLDCYHDLIYLHYKLSEFYLSGQINGPGSRIKPLRCFYN